jgi:hypothetical protein
VYINQNPASFSLFSHTITQIQDYTATKLHGHTSISLHHYAIMESHNNFHQIGIGFCGSVWSPAQDPNKTSAFKREDGGPGRSLSNDFTMHKRAIEGLRRLADLNSTNSSASLAPPAQIPYCHRLIEASDTWWETNLQNFPTGYSPCTVLHTERIPPLPQKAREFLIDRYCPDSGKKVIKADINNKDCLVRAYLGRRRFSNAKSRFFSLRNFPLHLDQMEDLGVNITLYAAMIADALAALHWYAAIDANDVEFVIAPPRLKPTRSLTSNVFGDHTLWLLDFDCCKDMSMDEKGVEQAVEAFFKNDPFYPRPGQPLWDLFRNQYLQTSTIILGGKSRLPGLFIEKVEGLKK